MTILQKTRLSNITLKKNFKLPLIMMGLEVLGMYVVIPVNVIILLATLQVISLDSPASLLQVIYFPRRSS